MNKTKKITQGAMMLAIFGALVLIDRITAFWFTELVVLIAPIIIIMYSAMQTLKDGVFLSVGIIIMSFLLGNFNTTYLIYVPIGIITGLAYSFGVSKNKDQRSLLFLAIITYIIGELVATYIIYPILGIPIATMIAEYKEVLSQTAGISGLDYESIFSSIGLNFDKLLVIIYMISTILVGLLEGVLIHILALFLLRRFKIKDLGKIDLWQVKPNKALCYICIFSTFAFFFKDLIKNETLYYAAIIIALLGSMVLIYYGYLFLVLYGVIVLRKNVAPFAVILCFIIPIFMIALVLVGFLYGTGPLRTYLENKLLEINNNQNINKNE